MFRENAKIDPQPAGVNVTRKILGCGGSLMMVEVTFAKGAAGDPHRHPHEQVTYVAKGRFAFTLEGETKTLNPGDSVYIPANALHGTLALDDGVLVDVFTPIRDDFLK